MRDDRFGDGGFEPGQWCVGASVVHEKAAGAQAPECGCSDLATGGVAGVGAVRNRGHVVQEEIRVGLDLDSTQSLFEVRVVGCGVAGGVAGRASGGDEDQLPGVTLPWGLGWCCHQALEVDDLREVAAVMSGKIRKVGVALWKDVTVTGTRELIGLVFIQKNG